jgi:hypothetical protein
MPQPRLLGLTPSDHFHRLFPLPPPLSSRPGKIPRPPLLAGESWRRAGDPATVLPRRCSRPGLALSTRPDAPDPARRHADVTKRNLGPAKRNLIPRNNNLVPRNDNLVPRNDNLVPRNDNSIPRNDNLIPRNDNLIPRNDNPIPRNDNFLWRKVGKIMARLWHDFRNLL